jgi:formamidopyrimidine-DNA glycosylase
MPELPEVETIVNGLRGPLIGRTFTGVCVGWENIVAKPAVPEFQRGEASISSSTCPEATASSSTSR